MDESWTPEQRARAKDVAIRRLREVKQELEEEKSRRLGEEKLPVPIEYHNRFAIALEDLRRAGVNIPKMYESRVDTKRDEQVSGHYILGRISNVLELIDSDSSEAPVVTS